MTRIFVGEPADVLNRLSGHRVIDFRALTQKTLQFVGHIVRFDPRAYPDIASLRKSLGYGMEPLVICSVGGTQSGKELLELCGEAYSLLQEALPGLQLVLICGPRIDP